MNNLSRALLQAGPHGEVSEGPPETCPAASVSASLSRVRARVL